MSDVDEAKDAIAQAVFDMAEECCLQHKGHKDRGLEIYSAYIGKFLDNEEPEEGWKSKLYAKVMKPKILAAWSQSVQAMVSNKDMWEVAPREGETIDPSGMKARLKEAADAADLEEKLKSGMFDGFLYGTQSHQAPVVETRKTRVWKKDLTNPMSLALAMVGKPRYKPVFKQENMPSIIPRSFFEMFPWPYSQNVQAGEGVFHRPFITKYDLNDLAQQPGFDAEVIGEILKEPAGDSRYEYVNQRMQTRGWQGSRLKGYDLIFFAGKLGRDKLTSISGFEQENGRYIEGLFWVVNTPRGPKIIKAQPNPTVGKLRPFLIQHYEQMPGESHGMGIGENSIDIAKSIAGAIRLFADGKKLALPMIGVDSSKLAVKGGVVEFSPAKIWDFKGISPKDAIFPIELPDMTTGLMPFIEFLERLHDEITGLPKWTTGVDSKMLNKTATGISMIMNASSQLVRGAIENMDDYILEPLGERWYDWFMEDPETDPGIKGDFIISASGLTNLMQREALNPQLLNLLTFVINPAVQSNPWALKLLRMVGENIGIKDVDSALPSPDKLMQQTNIAAGAAAGAVPVSAPGAPAPGMPPVMVG